MGRQKTTSKTIEAAERRRYAVSLRLSGATFESIGIAMGVSTTAAYKMVKKALTDTQKATELQADSLREIELQRLDALQLGIWKKAKDGGLQAIDRALRIMERRAKLLGIDAPEQRRILADLTDADKAILERFKNE